VIKMFSSDNYVKAFIDGNWLSIAILLFILKGIATNFRITLLKKIYRVLANAYQFVRPGTEIQEHEEKPKT